MNSSAVAMALDGAYGACQLADRTIVQPSHWFLTIPPERIGLHGEFDYYGLSKRVSRCLSHAEGILGCLKVRQRGRVVVLSGKLHSPYQLKEVVNLALTVDGVDEVDTRCVVIPKAG